MKERYFRGKPTETYVKRCKTCQMPFRTTSKAIVYCSEECSGKIKCIKCEKPCNPNTSMTCFECREPLHVNPNKLDFRSYKWILDIERGQWRKVFLEGD